MYASTAFFTSRYSGHPVRAEDGTRVTSRVFTAPRWPLATSNRMHTCDVTALSGPSLVYQYDERKKRQRKKKAHRSLLNRPVKPSIFSPIKTEELKLNFNSNIYYYTGL